MISAPQINGKYCKVCIHSGEGWREIKCYRAEISPRNLWIRKRKDSAIERWSVVASGDSADGLAWEFNTAMKQRMTIIVKEVPMGYKAVFLFIVRGPAIQLKNITEGCSTVKANNLNLLGRKIRYNKCILLLKCFMNKKG